MSARFVDIFKHKKKEGAISPREELSKEVVEPQAAEGTSTAVPAPSSEAPQLEKPVETEPLQLDEAVSAVLAMTASRVADKSPSSPNPLNPPLPPLSLHLPRRYPLTLLVLVSSFKLPLRLVYRWSWSCLLLLLST